MTSLFHSKLSKDFSLILNDADDYNVIIKVGENENTMEFRAHSVILRARSPYFKSALSSNWITNQNNMIIIDKKNIQPNIFDLILRYIYVGELYLIEQSGEDILGLLIASDELLMDELFYHVQDYLIENLTKLVRYNFPYLLNIAFKLINCKKLQNYIQDYLIESQSTELILENFSFISNIAFKLNNFKKLQDYIVEYICKNSYLFIYTHLFLSLDKDILYKVLESEELRIREVVTWEHLIKWGINQIPGLAKEKCDIDKLSNEALYKELKEVLNQFIPLIRFVDITSDDFNDKIKPYKIIIPYQIYEEIEDFYNKGISPKITLPPRIRKIGSKLIKQNLVKIILNWINKEGFGISGFKLIYRGSIDGMRNETFKNICKGEVKSLVLIKVKYTNKIFGGYSSIGFNSIGDRLLLNGFADRFYYKSADNFIFSFENDKDTQNMKISRVINYNKAILSYSCNNDHGFSFGENSLTMHNNLLHVYNTDDIYEDNVNTNSDYYIEEIETFVVAKQ